MLAFQLKGRNVMRLHDIIVFAVITILVGNLVGFLIRLIQEQFSLSTLFKGIVLFPVFIVFIVSMPILIPLFIHKQESVQKYTVWLRIFLSVISFPLACVYVIGNVKDLIDKTIISTLTEEENKRKEKLLNKGKAIHKDKTDRSNEVVGEFRNVRLVFSKTTIDLTNRVYNAAIFTK